MPKTTSRLATGASSRLRLEATSIEATSVDTSGVSLMRLGCRVYGM